MEGLGSGGQGGCSTSPCVWLGQLSAFTEGTIEEKQAGCTTRLRLGPADSVLLAMAWPGLQSHVGVLARSPNSSSSCPCLTSHCVLATFQLLLNSEHHYPPACWRPGGSAAQGCVPTPWGCSQVCLSLRLHPLQTSQQTFRKPGTTRTAVAVADQVSLQGLVQAPHPQSLAVKEGFASNAVRQSGQ